MSDGRSFVSFVQGKLPLRLKLIHGFGAIAFGVKDSGFSFFLLLFYNQVLGMDAGLVSLALLIALLVDAVIDPILGNLSDRTYSRWGRRLPWLYVAPIPLAFVWVLLWSPPGGEAPSFLGLLGIAISVRILLSACEVPSVALVPEITADYEERTTLFRYRYLSGWIGGILMMVMATSVFMPGSDGLLERDGYVPFGIFGALLMAVSVLGSALGQHRLVAQLPEVKPPPFSLKNAFGEIVEAFSEKAFIIFAIGGLAAYVSQGMTFSISNYVNVFIWQFDETALMVWPGVLFLSALLMFVIVNPLHRKYGKPRTAMLAALTALALFLLPYVLLIAGAWPPLGSDLSSALYLVLLLFGNTMGIVTLISASSMVAEIVEAYLERTGRRAEGAFYSGNWLVQKCATGFGIFITGQIIAFSQLPNDAVPGEVPWEIILDMILLYGGLTTVFGLIAAYWLGRFPITREEHEARVAALAARQSVGGPPPMPQGIEPEPAGTRPAAPPERP